MVDKYRKHGKVDHESLDFVEKNDPRNSTTSFSHSQISDSDILIEEQLRIGIQKREKVAPSFSDLTHDTDYVEPTRKKSTSLWNITPEEPKTPPLLRMKHTFKGFISGIGPDKPVPGPSPLVPSPGPKPGIPSSLLTGSAKIDYMKPVGADSKPVVGQAIISGSKLPKMTDEMIAAAQQQLMQQELLKRMLGRHSALAFEEHKRAKASDLGAFRVEDELLRKSTYAVLSKLTGDTNMIKLFVSALRNKIYSCK